MILFMKAAGFPDDSLTCYPCCVCRQCRRLTLSSQNARSVSDRLFGNKEIGFIFRHCVIANERVGGQQ